MHDRQSIYGETFLNCISLEFHMKHGLEMWAQTSLLSVKKASLIYFIPPATVVALSSVVKAFG